MTTTAYQWVFDNAEAISINKRGLVSQTISRDNTVRAVSRGGQIWRFDVTLPNGMPWDKARPYIEAIDAADRFTTAQVQINNSGYNSWLTAYRGDAATTAGFVVTATKGSNQLTITSAPTTTAVQLGAGDIIQLGNFGSVYSVVSDVATGSNTITVNRPVIDASSTYDLKIGPAVTWNVICTQLPTWTISGRNQVSWTGSFSFYEVAQ